jgi:hypothetical protein
MDMIKDQAWPRKVGDSIAVDTNYMRQIYIATPQTGLDSPSVRANRYLRALEHRGMTIKEWCEEGSA